MLDRAGFLDLHFSLKSSCPCEFCSLKHVFPEMLFFTGSLCIMPSSFYIQIIASWHSVKNQNGPDHGNLVLENSKKKPLARRYNVPKRGGKKPK